MSEDQEQFDAECGHIFATQGYLVIIIDSPQRIGSVIGPLDGEPGQADVQPLRIVGISSPAEYAAQCALIGESVRPFPGSRAYYYRCESD